MQPSCLRVVTAGNPGRLTSLMPAYNRTIPIVKVLLPYVSRSPPLLSREMAEVLAPADVPDQTKCSDRPMILTCTRSMTLMQARLVPLHFPLKNAYGYESEARSCLLLQLV